MRWYVNLWPLYLQASALPTELPNPKCVNISNFFIVLFYFIHLKLNFKNQTFAGDEGILNLRINH